MTTATKPRKPRIRPKPNYVAALTAAEVRRELAAWQEPCSCCGKGVPRGYLLPHKAIGRLCIPCFLNATQTAVEGARKRSVPFHIRARVYLERTGGRA